MVVSSSVGSLQCYGTRSGSILVSVTGGMGPYGYRWSDSAETSSNRIGLSSGVYTLTITDLPANCQVTKVYEVIQPVSPLRVISNVKHICSGQSEDSGALSPFVSGGLAPYTYELLRIGGIAIGSYETVSSSILRQLRAGTYRLRLRDGLGCEVVSETSTVRSISNIEPKAAFLISTYGLVGDELVAIEVSGSSPDRLSWYVDGVCTRTSSKPDVGSNNKYRVTSFTFPVSGVHTVTMSGTWYYANANLGVPDECVYDVSQVVQIESLASSLQQSSSGQGKGSSRIFAGYLSQSTDHSSGDFNVFYSVNNMDKPLVQNMEILMYDLQGRYYGSHRYSGVRSLDDTVNFGQLGAGFYLLFLKLEGENKYMATKFFHPGTLAN